MDSQDQHNKNGSSGHENHVCHKCGWPFPNPHPSAKQRRAHKKVCGTIEGYKPIESNPDHSPLPISDDDAASDDDQRTPSPKIEKTILKELGSDSGSGLGEMSSKSEDEVFSDAVMELPDGGISPGIDERVIELNNVVKKLVTTDSNGSQLLKDDTTADTSVQQNNPALSSQMSDLEVVESAKDQSEIAKSLNDSEVEKSSVEPSREIGLQFESSPAKFETPTDVLTKETDVDVDRGTEKDVGKDKSLTDEPRIREVREISEEESCSGKAGEQTLSPLGQEFVTLVADRERETELEAPKAKILDSPILENVVHEPVSTNYKQQIKDGQTSDLPTDGSIEHKKDENDELQPDVAKSDVFPLIKLAEDVEDSTVVYPHAIDGSGQSKMIGFSELREGKENLQTSSLEMGQEETKVLDVKKCNPSEAHIDRIVEENKGENDDMIGNVAKNDVSPLVKPLGQMEGSAADFAYDIDGNGEIDMLGAYSWQDEGKEDLQNSNFKQEQEELWVFDLKEHKEEDTVLCDLSEAQKDHGHSLLEPKSLPVMDNVKLMIEDFKDYNTLKSILPLDLGSAEVIRLVQGDDKAIIVEEGHSGLHSGAVSRSTTTVEEGHSGLHSGDLSRSTESTYTDLNNLEQDVDEKSVQKHPEGNYELIKESGEDQCPCGLEASSGAPRTEPQNIQLSYISEELHLHPIDKQTSQKAHPENAMMDHLDTQSGVFGKVITHTANLSEAENADNNEMNRAKSVATMDQSDIKSGIFGEEIMQRANFIEVEKADNSEMNSGKSIAAIKESSTESLEDDFSANKKTIQENADNSYISINNQTNSSTKADQNQHHERATAELLDTAECKSTKVVDREIVLMNTEAADESAWQTAKSTTSDMVSEKVINARGNTEQTYLSVDRFVDESSREAPQGSGSVNITTESIGSASKDIEVNHDDIVLASDKNPEDSISEEVVPLHVDHEPLKRSSISVEGSLATGVVKNSSDFSSEPLKGEVGNKLENQHDGASATDISFASSSRADSLEGHWGSVSVMSTQSDTTASAEAGMLPFTDTQPPEKSGAYVQMPKHATDERHPDKSDVFEHPSFMTLVESASGVSQKATPSEIETAHNNQHPKPADLRAGWFPSLSNVVNESQGRKKNEEIIAKVSNWSTGKQHSPLKNLLGEAKSPNLKQVPTETRSHAIAMKSDGAAVTTANVILHSDAPNDQAADKEMAKEWNSPARYPSEIKREKRKGRPYWVQFVCCSSVHRDL